MEDELLYNAINKIQNIKTLDIKVLGMKVPVGKRRVDAQILLQHNKIKKKYNVELKQKIVPAQIMILLNQMAGLEPYIFIADYITAQAKELLRELNIPYLDTAGNMFINENDLYILVENHKTNRNKLTIGNRAFTKTGLKVVYQFLIHPDYLNKTYRFIGKQAMVTIDTIGKVIQELLRDKYIIQTKKKEYQFFDKARLFQEWVTAYNKTLRPKLKQIRCRRLNKKLDWKKLSLPKGAHWGGAIAGEKLTNYLIADNGLIYIDTPFQEIMRNLKLIPDDNGPMLLIEKFWPTEDVNEMVHPMLVYADLIQDLNPRYVETANKIYKEYVENQL